ncbi:type VI secretion system tube protein Hcp [Granulicella aggregans]|nr:type VI secretion system tube protein Hcp [Granulicella aggregans]
MLSSLVVILTVGCGSIFAQDNPITARTATIAVTLKSYGDTAAACVFNASSVKYNIEQTLNIGSQSSGAGAGKITFNPLSIVKPIDLCSPVFFSSAVSGTAFSEVLVVISPPAGNASQSTFVIRLGLAAVKDLTDAAADKTVIQEQVLLEYGDLTLAELSPSGSLLSCRGWDRVRNVQDSSHCSELQGK